MARIATRAHGVVTREELPRWTLLLDSGPAAWEAPCKEMGKGTVSAGVVRTCDWLQVVQDAAAVAEAAPSVADALARVAGLAVPAVADTCVVQEVSAGGEGDPVAPAGVLVAPVRARGRMIGALRLGVDAGSGRVYGPEDEAFARLLAGQVALGLEHAGLLADLAHAEARLAAVLGALGDAVVVQAADGRVAYANEAAADLAGAASASDLIGRVARDLVADSEVTDASGRPVRPEELPSGRVRRGRPAATALLRARSDGRERWYMHRATPLQTPEGIMAVSVIQDVTRRHRDGLAERLLARASEVLGAAPDLRAMLEAVTALAAGHVADWCAIELVDGRGRIELKAASGPRPGEAAGELAASVLAGGEVIGTLRLGWGPAGRRFDPEDIRLADELARRVGAAVRHARLQAERDRTAGTLERALLPPALSEPPGWEVAAHYRPAGAATLVGGDFYDLFEVPGGWMAIAGDVAGKGAEAASQTSLARYTLRAVGALTADPVEALRRLNGVVVERREPGLCSAVCLRLEGGRVVTACAGHPPPLLVRRDGGIEELPVAGPLLGLDAGAGFAPHAAAVRPGDAVVLYTDGVTDAVGAGRERFGGARLRAALAAAAGLGPEDLVASVDAALDGFQAGPRGDDQVLVALARAHAG